MVACGSGLLAPWAVFSVRRRAWESCSPTGDLCSPGTHTTLLSDDCFVPSGLAMAGLTARLALCWRGFSAEPEAGEDAAYRRVVDVPPRAIGGRRGLGLILALTAGWPGKGRKWVGVLRILRLAGALAVVYCRSGVGVPPAGRCWFGEALGSSPSLTVGVADSREPIAYARPLTQSIQTSTRCRRVLVRRRVPPGELTGPWSGVRQRLEAFHH